jgi:hypothetical protein
MMNDLAPLAGGLDRVFDLLRRVLVEALQYQVTDLVLQHHRVDTAGTLMTAR